MVAVPSIGRASEVTPRRRAPEADATRHLYERYARQIHAYCLHQLGSREEAEDAVQSTFLNAFRGLKRGVDPEFESAWLYKIAENVCLTRQRSSYRRRRIESPGDLDAMQDILPAHESDNDQLIGLPAALEGMPEQQRRALLLREWQGLSYREIAGELGLSQSAVETLLFRARRSLANALTDEFGARKTGFVKLRAGGDAGSLVALVKAVVFSSGAKVAATVAAVAATSAVAATPAVRHSAESAFAPAHAPRVRPAAARHVRRSLPFHATPASALGATRLRHAKRVAAATRAASASHISHLRLVPASASASTSRALVAPSPRRTADDPIVAVPPAPAPPVVDVPAAPAADSVPIPVVPTPADTGSGAGSLPPAPPTPTVKGPGKGPQSEAPVVVVTPVTVQAEVKAARKAAKADERAARDHGRKSDAPAPTPPSAPAPTTPASTSPGPAPTTLPPVTIAPSPADAQPATLAAPAVAPAAPAPPVVAPMPPVPPVSVTPVMPAVGNTDHGVRNGHRK